MTEPELNTRLQTITPPDEAARAAAHAHWAALAKPLGGLGSLETMLEDAAALTGTPELDFARRADRILQEELPNEMRGRNQSYAEDQAEAMSLYAEYAIDFATQTMRHALIAALTAVILQRRAEAKPNENGEKENRYE